MKNYKEFAHNIGLAFQIRDDFLGIWGDKTQTGKSADNDLRRKKKTLPVLYALDTVSNEQLHSLYATDTPLSDPEIQFVRKCLLEANADTFAKQAADIYIERAFSALAKINIAVLMAFLYRSPQPRQFGGPQWTNEPTRDGQTLMGLAN